METAAEMELEADTVVLNSQDAIAQFQGVENPSKFRNLVHQVSGTEISSVQAKNFLDIFGEQLAVELTQARKNFIERHFGNKNK